MSEEKSAKKNAPSDESETPQPSWKESLSWLTTGLRSIHRGVEFCGKHPFATGLFALIGIGGFILTVIGFQFDREQAVSTAEQMQRVETKLEGIALLPREIPSYSGGINKDFAGFILNNTENVFQLELSFTEEESRNIVSWDQEREGDEVLWFEVDQGEPGMEGTEFGFWRDDPEVYFNARFRDAVHASGFFKVHSFEGPRQGWYSVTLKGVGREHVTPLK